MIGVPKCSDNGMDGSHIKEVFHPEALSIDFDRLLPAIRGQIGVVAAVCVICSVRDVRLDSVLGSALYGRHPHSHR
jgi:hypothetical protein